DGWSTSLLVCATLSLRDALPISGVRAHLAVQADAVADGLADRLAQFAGQPFGGGAGGQPARFQHEDALPGQPGLVEQRQRHTGGDRKSTRLNSSHVKISYAVFCL